MNSLVSVQWLKENLNNPNLILLDASPKTNKSKIVPKFTDIQIPNTRKFDTENVFVDTSNPVPNMFPSPTNFEEECQNIGVNSNSIIVVYDNLGVYMSPRVWWMFKTFGHKNIAVLNGGLSAWVEAGFETENIISRKFSKGNFKATYKSKNIADATFILKNIQSKEVVVIDARSEGRFYGSLPEPRENMQSGHIPNALNVPFKKVLKNGQLKSSLELEKVFSEIPIKNKDLIFSCGSGVTACILLLASEQINSNKHVLYDGSWSEWGLGNKFPVEK
jgi:thiosulfate/3-mercaptopyruvate sulfurtransferase